MRLSLPTILCFLPSLLAAHQPAHPDYHTHDFYAVHIHPSVDPTHLAHSLGLEFGGKLGDLDDHYLLRLLRHDHDIIHRALATHKSRKRSLGLRYRDSLLDAILFHQKQHLKPPKVKRTPLPPSLPDRHPRQAPPSQHNAKEKPDPQATKKRKQLVQDLELKDPIFADQWHLFNAVQLGHDLNVTGVWTQGITGQDSTVCIIDDGLDMDSNDLKDNYFAAGSYDFNDNTDEPRPRLSDDRHGTRCAGEVAAVKNDVCGVGVAWNAKVSGIRILSKPITDADEAKAMTHGFQQNDIYSCSWGPPDDGKEMGAPGILIKRAMVTAIQKGRSGLGTIYVFAAGNGAASDDNCNFDGYTNSIYSITVGAIDRKGLHPYYSEKCSAQLAVTYSSGSGDQIHTTDVGVNQCYTRHGGTSAAGPLAAGVLALVLSVRSELTWRDMQWLTVQTAVPFDNDDAAWQDTPMGKKFSHQYGYGKLDAWAIVEAAKHFELVKPQAWYFSPWQHIRHAIPQGDVGLSSNFKITKDMMSGANLERLEHVTVTMNVEHSRRGDLSVELRSPNGVISHLSTARRYDEYSGGYVDWTFMSVAHWGEEPVGDWVLIVKDTNENRHNGTLVDWKINLFGECIDPAKQDLLPLPTEHDDDDHDKEDATATTMSVNPSTTGDAPGNPSGHIDRPVNQKPSDVDASATPTTTTAAFEPPVPAPTEAEEPEAGESAAPSETPKTDKFLPSPFPTFGVSKRTQVWIYGALALIVIFCASLAGYFYMARKKRQRNVRDSYEFDRLDEDDEDGDQEWGAGRAGGRKGKRRAGELYDAFAGEGESDEDLFSDEEKEEYHDDEGDEAERLGEKGGVSSDEGSSGESSGGMGQGRRLER